MSYEKQIKDKDRDGFEWRVGWVVKWRPGSLVKMWIKERVRFCNRLYSRQGWIAELRTKTGMGCNIQIEVREERGCLQKTKKQEWDGLWKWRAGSLLQQALYKTGMALNEDQDGLQKTKKERDELWSEEQDEL